MLTGYEDLMVRNAYYIAQTYSIRRLQHNVPQEDVVNYVDAEVEHILENLDLYLEEVNGIQYNGSPEYHRIISGTLAIADYLTNTIFGDLSISLNNDIVFSGYIPATGTIILDRI